MALDNNKITKPHYEMRRLYSRPDVKSLLQGTGHVGHDDEPLERTASGGHVASGEVGGSGDVVVDVL